ncbi:hypothetical protein BDB00DRAFT_820758 [Zychaea mexicana]|uniref:uncharacterized protein n=1 Tax=Zychaea mexicana TaxID=64656 RepID=UPI0022FF123E|nr:uncharacterized protein BDB00DRAFT_820758 [Zychaea mexicana]KAI9494075.1 hypothetical protein BDB00DRAFT_820758 [Zychaea mexicana]
METSLTTKYQQKSNEAEDLKRQLHDLQVENRVLRSLVFEQRQKDNTASNDTTLIHESISSSSSSSSPSAPLITGTITNSTESK